MDRRKDLLSCLSGNTDERLVGQLIDEILFLENQLKALKKLPFIKVHPTNPELQKATPASKLYIQVNAQYNSAIRTLVSLSGNDNANEDSPLRKWVKKHVDPE